MSLEGLDDVAWHSVDHAYGPRWTRPVTCGRCCPAIPR